ncbi:hypothetical protein Cme02nite_50380 [Catellatospora methionotrophica]|uniref:Carrier domain-containing protein n=1 Tax=Catellatospora methionotrophica TaxID=121620 RepID=A0A8J3PIS7_9ACTN|nr:phosphopantetheine-binding protein [Catellatospora methionotrophica]GIG16706.1 hypothetical protein Cme02nite_50380 [Catellatospora methionotrophica]
MELHGTTVGHASAPVETVSDSGERPDRHDSTPLHEGQPVDACHTAVARIWAEVLDLDEVAPGDDFFDLGGVSLQVITVIRRTRAELGVQLRTQTLFDASRLGDFVACVRAAEAAPDAATERLR